MSVDRVRWLVANVVRWGPWLVLAGDYLLYRAWGYPVTITAVVRHWHAENGWTEFWFVVGCLLLYLHFFRNWP